MTKSIIMTGFIKPNEGCEKMHESYKRLLYAAKTLKGIESPADLSRALNISPYVVYNWNKRGVSKEGMIAAQEIIGCSVTWIETGKGNIVSNPLQMPPHDKIAAGYVPVISWEQAAVWRDILIEADVIKAEDWILSPANQSKNAYFLRVKSIDMFDPKASKSLSQGDLVLVEVDKVPDNNSLVVVHIPGNKEVIIRQLIIASDRKYLQAINPNWPDQIIPMPPDARICGVASSKIVNL